ncbi:MAG: agmatine deiminase family protein, partial [Pseudomonadota bacterium]
MPGRRQFFGQLMMLGAGAGMSVKESTAEPELLHVPGEESPHELTLMQWPVHRGVYSDAAFLDQVQQTVATIANAIAEFEPVVILADREDFRPARRKLTHRVAHWDVPTEDLWCRDSGPLFAWREDGQRVVSHLRFNGWGGRQVHDRDGQIAARVAAQLNEPLVDSGLVGEAGGVEHDGHGLLLAHESSWVHDNRNPGMTRAVIEERLLRAYGAETL